jgi:hypothetical protein
VTSKEIFHASRDTQLDGTIQSVDGILKLQGQLLGKIADLGEPIPSIGQLRMKYWPKGRILPHRRAFEITIEAASIFKSWKAAICRREDSQDRTLLNEYITGETLLEVLYHTGNSNGGPFPDSAEDRKFTTWIHSMESMMATVELYGRIFSKLPWLLAWILSGPFAVSCSFMIVLQLLRRRFVIDPPMMHSDPTRQTWVVGRTDCDNLVGLFPAPFLTTPDTMPSKVGDSIVIFKGGSRPYVIRRHGGHWKIIGNINLV